MQVIYGKMENEKLEILATILIFVAKGSFNCFLNIREFRCLPLFV